MKQKLRRISLTVFVMLVLFMVTGVVYVYLTDSNSKKDLIKNVSTNTSETSLPTPVYPGSNDPEGVSVVGVTSPVSPGMNSSVTINTNAGSSCQIAVSYNGGLVNDSGLAPKASDPYGSVTWSWTVGSNVAVGTWPIKVTCTFHNKEGVVDTSYQVVNGSQTIQ